MSRDNQLDRMAEDISDIKVTMAENTASLKVHILRTEQNEEMIALLKADIDPIKKHVAFVKGAAWMLGITGTIILALISTGILKKLI